MLQTVEGIYANGQVIFIEKPPKNENVKVLITFTKEKIKNEKLKPRLFGTLKGTFKMAENFNDEISDFEDYK